MNPKIQTRIDSKRGCGYRKEGGLYLISAALNAPCGKLPIQLDVCPTCHAGVKPARGWTWFDLAELSKDIVCFAWQHGTCIGCPVLNAHKVGLFWVGSQFYKTPGEFLGEASLAGISRRLSRIPHGFVLGETIVAMAHRHGANGQPGIFSVFKPTAIEYVVKGDETEDAIDALIKRGITPVKVEHKSPEIVLAL